LGSLEELFIRHEVKFSTLRDADSITDWLSDSGKHAPKSRYKETARMLSEPFKIESEIETAIDKSELQRLRKRARILSPELRQAELTGEIDERIEIFDEEERITIQITEFRERVEELKSLPREELRDLFKETSDQEERALAKVALREAQPQTLGGLIRGSQMRVQATIRRMF